MQNVERVYVIATTNMWHMIFVMKKRNLVRIVIIVFNVLFLWEKV
jgi:hypothetical protein